MAVVTFGGDSVTFGGSSVTFGGPVMATFGNNDKLSGFTEETFGTENPGGQSLSNEYTFIPEDDPAIGVGNNVSFTTITSFVRKGNGGEGACTLQLLTDDGVNPQIVKGITPIQVVPEALNQYEGEMITVDVTGMDGFTDMDGSLRYTLVVATAGGGNIRISCSANGGNYHGTDVLLDEIGDTWVEDVGSTKLPVIFIEGSVASIPTQAPTLSTPYSNVSTPNDASSSIDLSTNWTGASTYTITGLPTGAAQVGTTGVVDYTFTGTVERTLVTVVATNGFGSSQAGFNWNVYDAAGANEISRNTTLQAIVTKLGG